MTVKITLEVNIESPSDIDEKFMEDVNGNCEQNHVKYHVFE